MDDSWCSSRNAPGRRAARPKPGRQILEQIDPRARARRASLSIVLFAILIVAASSDARTAAPDTPAGLLQPSERAQGLEFLPYPRGSHNGLVFSNEQRPECGARVRFVNSSCGNLTFQWVDLALPGPVHLTVGHVYDSSWVGATGLAAEVAAADFGPGWRLRPGDFLILGPDGTSLTLYPDDGTHLDFVRRERGTYVPRQLDSSTWGPISALGDGGLQAAVVDGSIKVFRPSSRAGLYLLSEIRDPSGEALRLVRDADRITQIEGSSGPLVEFTRQGLILGKQPSGFDRIVLIRDTIHRGVIFRYDNSGALSETVTPRSERFALEYDKARRLVAARGPLGERMLGVTYGTDGRVSQLSRYEEWLSFQYDPQAGRTLVVARDGGQTTYLHDSSGRTAPGIRPREAPSEDERSSTDTLDEGDNPMEKTCEDYGSDWGYCDASVPGWACMGDCLGGGGGFGGGGGGSGSGGGGGGDGGGGDGSGPCDVWWIEPSPVGGLTCQLFSFSIQPSFECGLNASWTALSPYATTLFGYGPDFATAFVAAGVHGVRATVDGISHDALVAVDPRPLCQPSISGPSSPLVGESVEYQDLGSNCFNRSWSGGTSTCPDSGSGGSWMTAFVASGPRTISLTGNDGCSIESTQLRGVTVLPCSVGITGPSSGQIQQALCFQAVPGGATTGTYTWSASGGQPPSGSSNSFCTSFSASGPKTVQVSLNKSVPGCTSANCGEASRTVSIQDPPPSVSINASNPAGLLLGNSTTLTASGRDGYGNPTAGTYSWTSSNPSILAIAPNGSEVAVQGASPGSATLTVGFQTFAGSATDQVTIHVVNVQIEEVNFTGAGNVDIRIDGGTDIDSPGGAGTEDIEWARGSREGANTNALWNTAQSAPAAFVKGNPLRALIRLTSQPASVSAVEVRGASPSPYADLTSPAVPISAGAGMGTFVSIGADSAVDVNNVVVTWRLQAVTIGGLRLPLLADLRTTVHRIYTLYAAPAAPMDEPWATVLELAGGIAKGLSTDLGVVEEMTRGIHYSKWLLFRTEARFIDPLATLVYDPNVSRTAPAGPPSNIFAIQVYDLEDFMLYLAQPQDVQQCNDNSNLLAGVFLRALGIRMDPLWIAHNYDLFDQDNTNDDAGDLLVTTTYFPAGRTAQQSPIAFGFHQFGLYAGRVYDPSTRPSVTGDPYMGMPLIDYLNSAFPGQIAAGYITTAVTEIRIGPVAIAPSRSGTATAASQAGSTGAMLLQGEAP